MRHETVLEAVAEYDIGTQSPELDETHRPDMPWGRPPPPGRSWISDEEMRDVLPRLAEPS